MLPDGGRYPRLPRVKLHHREVLVDAEVQWRVLAAQLHLVSQVFVVDLRVHSHKHGEALIDFAVFLAPEQQVLGEH